MREGCWSSAQRDFPDQETVWTGVVRTKTQDKNASRSSGKRSRGRPKETWRRAVEKERAELGLTSWAAVAAVATNRDRWRTLMSGPIPHPVSTALEIIEPRKLLHPDKVQLKEEEREIFPKICRCLLTN